MLDVRQIRENPSHYRDRLSLRYDGSAEAIDRILLSDERRRKLLQETETLKGERNRRSQAIGQLRGQGGDIAAEAAEVRQLGEQIARNDAALLALETAQTELLLGTPNLPHESVPTGQGAAENRIERVVGPRPEFTFTPQPHWELGARLGLFDLPAATKISGSGFIVFRGLGARLERALLNYLLDLHTGSHGYTEVSTPFLVRTECMIGTSQLPKFAENMYAVAAEPPLYLVPTAEVPVTNLHREEIVPEASLPIRYTAYTPCFRREAGAAGKDTRGLLRVHQFDKVELVQIVEPSQSYAALETLVGHAERVLRELGLHYRVATLCTGELGFGAAKCYDLEVWAPGVEAWLEVSSCSNFEDYQARRLNLRYRAGDGKNKFCHTLNGSGTALPRLYAALLETHQQADGRVAIPEPLRPYLGNLAFL